MAIYMNNENDVTLSDSNQTLTTTFIKAYYYTVLDDRLDNLLLNVQYGFYLNVVKWFENWRTNKLRVDGLPYNRSIELDYSRTNDGPDMELFIYEKVKEDILNYFPTWVAEDLEIVST